MQAQTSRGNFAGYRRAYVVDGQDATLILKGKKKGATGGGLKPSAVVIGRIVVTDRSVVAANRNVEVVAEGVGKQHALDIHPENVDRKSTRLNSSHVSISYAVFCLKKKSPTIAPRRIYEDPRQQQE